MDTLCFETVRVAVNIIYWWTHYV